MNVSETVFLCELLLPTVFCISLWNPVWMAYSCWNTVRESNCITFHLGVFGKFRSIKTEYRETNYCSSFIKLTNLHSKEDDFVLLRRQHSFQWPNKMLQKWGKEKHSIDLCRNRLTSGISFETTNTYQNRWQRSPQSGACFNNSVTKNICFAEDGTGPETYRHNHVQCFDVVSFSFHQLFYAVVSLWRGLPRYPLQNIPQRCETPWKELVWSIWPKNDICQFISQFQYFGVDKKFDNFNISASTKLHTVFWIVLYVWTPWVNGLTQKSTFLSPNNSEVGNILWEKKYFAITYAAQKSHF